MFKDNRGSGVSTFSVANFLSHSPENFRRGIPYFSSKVGYRKSLEKKGGGTPTFSVEKFLSRIAEKLRRGILYCCIEFL